MESHNFNTSIPTPSPNPTVQDHLFISYSRTQKELVDRLRRNLEMCGHVVWIDYSSIPLGAEFPQEITDAIYWSTVILVCVSAKAAESEWVKRECWVARQYGKKMIPVFLSPISDPNGSLAMLGFDPLHQVADFASSYEDAFRNLLKTLPVPLRVKNHCNEVVRDLEMGLWDADVGYYITEYAQNLPMNARFGDRRGNQVDLISYLQSPTSAPQRTIVLGQPGAGKSVALGRLAWVLASREIPDIPVLIRLSDYEKDTLIARIHTHLRATHQLPEDVNSILENYRGYFLLDGLNEVPDELRHTLLDEIEYLESRYPRFRIVVSSRIQDEAWQALRRRIPYTTLLIQEIKPEDAQMYLQIHLKDVEYATEVWATLNRNLRELVRTPLILNLIKDVVLDSKENGKSALPKNRGELYNRVVEKLLRRDDKPGQTEATGASNERRRLTELLERLALQMQIKGKPSFSEDQVIDILENEDAAMKLLKKELLRKDDAEGVAIRFPHHTIQEYFAARAIRKDYSTYLEYALDLRWIEVFVQLAGILEKVDEFARDLAKSNPWLAWWCIVEGGDVSVETRAAIEASSVGLLSSPNTADRRRAAKTLAEMRLERVIPLLFRLLSDNDDETANAAVFGLWNFGSEIQTRVFYDSNVRNEQRIELANLFAESGDPRPGVGISTLRFPDIEWLPITAGNIDLSLTSTILSVAHDFHISRYPVTNAQFNAFIEAEDGYRKDYWWTVTGLKFRKANPLPANIAKILNGNTENYPAVFVSWYEAIAFCRWLSAKTGYEIRLPSETEWLRAAYGDRYLISKQEPKNSAETNTIELGKGETTPVGVYLSHTSVFDIPDIVGNVFCWCVTKWRDNVELPEDNDVDGESPRVIRGSAFSHPRDVDRMGDFPHYSSYCIGIRLVCSGGRHESS
jgi:hypothetical protein